MKPYPCSRGVAGNRPVLAWLVGLVGICFFGSSGIADEPVVEDGAPEGTDGVRVVLELGERDRAAEDEVRETRREAAVHLLRMRAERAGWDGATVELLDSCEIELMVPGVAWESESDLPEGFLEPLVFGFHLVHREKMPATTPDDERPDGYREMPLERVSPSGEVHEVRYFVRKEAEMAGALFRDAYAVETFQGGQYEVMLTFSEENVERFGDLTRDIVRENRSQGTLGQLAIVFDGELYSAPTVRGEIRSERVSVTGRFSREEGEEMALILGFPLESPLVVRETYNVPARSGEEIRR